MSTIVNETATEPRWIRDGVALWLTELRTLLVTMWTFVSSPRRFGTEWATGKLVAMNPVGVVLASATVLLPADYGLQVILGWDRRESVSVWVELARASRPYLFAVLAGLIIHGALRVFGSRRKVSTTIGLLLYTTALSWLLWCIGLVICYFTGVGAAVPNVLAALGVAWAALALDGAHRVRWWWCGPLLVAIEYSLLALVNLVLEHAHLT